MKTLPLGGFLLLSASGALANDVTSPINALFDAMRNHDSEQLLAQFMPDASLQRATVDKGVTTTDITRFAEAIGSANAFLDEHLLSITVQQSDNLASVWTPYVFYLDKKLSHCGVNSFQLVGTDQGWKIQYLIDNRHHGDCKDFIKQFAQ